MPQSEEATNSPATAYELYIMRHGMAEAQEGAGGADDAKRQLTPEGRKKMEEIARGLRKLGVELDWIVTSPLIRAIETAAIVGDSLDSNVPSDSCDALRPGGSPEELVTFLAKHPHRRRVLLVGHEPDLGELAARFVGAGRHAGLAFKKGGCCLISFDDFPAKPNGTLVWWLTPRIMRKLG